MDIEKIEILRMLHNGRPTIPEMGNYIGKANATVHKLLQELVAAGLVTPPRFRGAARDYHISRAGFDYLVSNGYVKEN